MFNSDDRPSNRGLKQPIETKNTRHKEVSLLTKTDGMKAGLRRDAVRSQVIEVLEAQETKETGNEEG